MTTPRRGAVLFPNRPVADLLHTAAVCRDTGFDTIWIGDSQSIWREAHVVAGAIATTLRGEVTLAAGVENLRTRHPAVTAAAWTTVAELNRGRVRIGVGAGDSSVRTIGLAPLTLAEIEVALIALREQLRGTAGEATRIAYADPETTLPVHLAASGPRMLDLAGRLADGAVVSVGTDPHQLAAAIGRVRGAAPSGATRDIVAQVSCCVDADPARARHAVRGAVARTVQRRLPIPARGEFREAVAAIAAAYSYQRHMAAGPAADLVPDRLVRAFAVAGTPDECCRQFERIAATGVDEISVNPCTPPGSAVESVLEQAAVCLAAVLE